MKYARSPSVNKQIVVPPASTKYPSLAARKALLRKGFPQSGICKIAAAMLPSPNGIASIPRQLFAGVSVFIDTGIVCSTAVFKEKESVRAFLNTFLFGLVTESKIV